MEDWRLTLPLRQNSFYPVVDASISLMKGSLDFGRAREGAVQKAPFRSWKAFVVAEFQERDLGRYLRGEVSGAVICLLFMQLQCGNKSFLPLF